MHANKIKTQRKARNGFFIGTVFVAFLAYLLWMFYAGHLHPIVFALYAAASLVSFAAYWVDKNAAERGRWRIQESTLHFMALLGGWPGAYAAQSIIRHKTVKQPFQIIFVITVILNILVVVLWFVLAPPSPGVLP